MTDRAELVRLKREMATHHAEVTFSIVEDGWIDGVFIVGAPGINQEYWPSVLAAAERMRGWLACQRKKGNSHDDH